MACSFEPFIVAYLNEISNINHSNDADNDNYNHTIHSYNRSKQRCISQFAIDLVLDYGKATPAGKGAESYSFDNRSWRKVCNFLGPEIRRYEKFRNIYVIIVGGTIVTVAWRH